MILLKLGGSLITDKNKPEHARIDIIERIAGEIADSWQNNNIQLILGHGSGSFGHSHANRHGTRSGASSQADWMGFIRVWQAADRLNRIMMDALLKAGLPAIRLSPSAMGMAENGQLDQLNMQPLQHALSARLLPVVYGDVIFDRQQGCTIASTEDVFLQIARNTQPTQILLAGIEDGVYSGSPGESDIIDHLTPDLLSTIKLSGSKSTDVTGGMLSKVHQAFQILNLHPQAQVHIFSGEKQGSISEALTGQPGGTRLTT